VGNSFAVAHKNTSFFSCFAPTVGQHCQPRLNRVLLRTENPIRPPIIEESVLSSAGKRALENAYSSHRLYQFSQLTKALTPQAKEKSFCGRRLRVVSL